MSSRWRRRSCGSLDAETRFVIISGAAVTFMTIDVVARGEVVRFGTGAK
jgi:hypothetical protein